MIRMVIADDHALVRAGLKALLLQLEGIEVAGEAGDGLEVVRLAHALSPDIVLMDIAMPGMNGLGATARLKAEMPDVRVILLSMHGTDEYLRLALEARADGYLLKGAELEELDRAIKAVMRGGTYLTPDVAKFSAEVLRQRRTGSTNLLDRLSSRQREVLQLLAEGHSTKAIAGLLSLSVKTIETHRAQLMLRLDLHDLASLVRFAMEVGLVPPPSR